MYDDEYQKEMIQKQQQEIIQKYQEDEQMMILLFAQWCVNHQLQAMDLYLRAHPEQTTNLPLQQALNQTLIAEESPEISDELLLELLFLFEQHELAQVVSDEIKKEK